MRIRQSRFVKTVGLIVACAFIVPLLLNEQRLGYRLIEKVQALRLFGTSSCHCAMDSPWTVIYSAPSRNLSYCPIPKVACTFWKRVVLRLNGGLKNKDPFRVDKSSVHLAGGIPFSSNIDMISKSYKFMFVRNPITRLWSAYIDKLFLPNFWILYGKKIVRKTRGLGMMEPVCGHDITFEEFLRYVVLTQDFEPHWMPMYQICSPLEFQPDFVGRLENFGADLKYLTERFNLTEAMQYFKGGSAQEMIDNIHFSIGFLKREKITCFTKEQLVRKLWKAFQFVGHISQDLPFPAAEVSANGVITSEFVQSLFLREMTKINLTKEEKFKQKEMFLRQALKPVSLMVRRGIKRLYNYDFLLFGYNASDYLDT